MGLVGVLWLWMSWSSSVCSPLLLFDAWRLLLVISHSLLLVCNLDIVIQTVVSGFTVLLWLPMSVVCDRLLFFWDFSLSGCSASLSDFCQLSPTRPRVAALLCAGWGAGKFELALPVSRWGVISPLYRFRGTQISLLHLPGVASWAMVTVPRVHNCVSNLDSLTCTLRAGTWLPSLVGGGCGLFWPRSALEKWFILILIQFLEIFFEIFWRRGEWLSELTWFLCFICLCS